MNRWCWWFFSNTLNCNPLFSLIYLFRMMTSASFALKALGTMDPHDICVKQIAASADLFWSIIWYYGSVYAALQEVGRTSACLLYSFRTCIEIIGTMFGSWRLSLIFGGQEFWLKSSGVDLNWTFPVLEQEGWSFLFRNRTELYRFRN